ncbi:MAG: glycosyltransferase family 2 protein, partial [Kiritimatiellae bacterium]|nr:glycosyltransferase family 2 protein [Kiritimatiellia bacterium]
MEWHEGRDEGFDGFSILVPTWNNLEYLKLCVEGIRRFSARRHQIVLHVNEGSDGTLEWARAEGLAYTHTAENTGICWGVNAARTLARGKYLVYMNDDMVPCPGWDTALEREIGRAPGDWFCLSATMIEPYPTRSKPVVAPVSFGLAPETFEADRLAREAGGLAKRNWAGSTRPPTVLPTALWDMVGGYSTELSPGLYSDPDFTMKLWQAGVRWFMGVGDSLVYHFVSKTLSRLKPNDGRRQFLRKWGISAKVFQNWYLRLGEDFEGALEEPEGMGFRLAKAKNRMELVFQFCGGQEGRRATGRPPQNGERG